MEQEYRERFNEVFTVLFSESRIAFENIAFSYVHDRGAAEDIVTECYMYLWEHKDDVDWHENLKGYMYMAIRSRCISYLRKKKASMTSEDGLDSSCLWKIESSLRSLENNDISSRIFRSEAYEIYRKELARMPEITRAVFVASREEGLTYAEIAERYGISVRKVTAEIQKGLRLLRVSLKDYLYIFVGFM